MDHPYSSGGPETASFGCFFIFMMLVALSISILMIVAFCKIFSKAGFHWALGLLMLVPLGNVIMPLFLAFSDWPVLREQRGFPQTPAPSSSESRPSNENFRTL